jgi:hypothetical protein
MANAKWMEYRLFCPVCNDYFTQLVVLHKLPKNFKIDPYLAGMVESHNHKAFQGAKAQKQPAQPAQQPKDDPPDPAPG